MHVAVINDRPRLILDPEVVQLVLANSKHAGSRVSAALWLATYERRLAAGDDPEIAAAAAAEVWDQVVLSDQTA